MEELTMEEKVLLWNAINRYVVACHGDPDKLAYGNSPRQRAVASCEKIVDGFIQNRRAAPENKPLTLSELRQMDENTDVEIVPLKPRLWHAYKEGISTNCFETYRYEDYGKTWFAYTRKPEGSKKSC